MIRYEIRERSPVTTGEMWATVAWFDDLAGARNYWSTAVFNGVEAALVKIEYKETQEHYHSADGKTVW